MNPIFGQRYVTNACCTTRSDPLGHVSLISRRTKDIRAITTSLIEGCDVDDMMSGFDCAKMLTRKYLSEKVYITPISIHNVDQYEHFSISYCNSLSASNGHYISHIAIYSNRNILNAGNVNIIRLSAQECRRI